MIRRIPDTSVMSPAFFIQIWSGDNRRRNDMTSPVTARKKTTWETADLPVSTPFITHDRE